MTMKHDPFLTFRRRTRSTQHSSVLIFIRVAENAGLYAQYLPRLLGSISTLVEGGAPGGMPGAGRLTATHDNGEPSKVVTRRLGWYWLPSFAVERPKHLKQHSQSQLHKGKAYINFNDFHYWNRPSGSPKIHNYRKKSRLLHRLFFFVSS